ncbi:MAG: NTP transferase domain-containing protein [Oscillospiraceae bacterium]|jgi:mannose-1-phosphate guanylyltransferase/phosphomannomutase|nr:NTP transferase domain-containing protein [Oscillospiraceae bacterium]
MSQHREDDYLRAVMLAGGAGTRLRPISAECPKPMVRFFDKPVMEYGIELLRRHGFTDIHITLQTMPQKITDYFGDGTAKGVNLRYSTEKEPLGTAGGVRAAMDGFLDGTVLVLSGDAVTDIDLTAAWEYHRSRRADATLVLSRRPNVLEYGLVMTDTGGRVTNFIEKPSHGQVFTDTVNTGIYILSPGALRRIPPQTAFDFARDLFPQMLRDNMSLYGYVSDRYWCDIGDSGAYLQCCRDVLNGKARLDLPVCPPPPAIPGLTVAQPSYIGRSVTLGQDVTVGPYAVIGEGSRLGDGASAEFCVLDGAVLEARASCRGAFIGRGAILKEGASVREGAAVGERAVIGENADVLEGTRIWPRKRIESGARVSGSVSRGQVLRGAVFDGGGTVRGLPHVDITPDFCLKLGLSAALAVKEEIALSWQGGEAASLAALALEAGVTAGGACVIRTDALTPSCAAFAGRIYAIPLSIFVRQEGRRLVLHFSDRDGLPPGRVLERKLESHTLHGDAELADPQALRPFRTVSGLAEDYAAAAAAPPCWAANGLTPVTASVSGGGADADILRRALSAAGCVSRGKDDGPIFQISGLSLSADLGNCPKADLPRLLGMMILIEAACGTAQLCLPYDAPACLEDIAARQGVRVFRAERDGEKARSLLVHQPYMRDPVFLAARLIHGCRKLRTTLRELNEALPAFFLSAGEVPIDTDQGAVMRELARQNPNAELVEGIRARTHGGWVRVAPLPSRRSLRIVAEGASEELAEEIRADFMDKIRTLSDGMCST